MTRDYISKWKIVDAIASNYKHKNHMAMRKNGIDP
jgi:hypothetical protein